MSLVITELSEAGIAMAADSAISMQSKGKTVSRVMWRKLLKVPKIKAGISYWGTIGHITVERFDVWLEWKIAQGVYADLRSFADYMTGELNNAAKSKLISANEPAGLHVAGFHTWSDGVARPTFYHVHNGHLHAEATVRTSEGSTVVSSGTATASFVTGSHGTSEIDALLLAASKPNAGFSYQTNAQPREAFKVHADFAPEFMTPEVADVGLKAKYLTHNGDFMPYKMVASGLNMANAALANLTAMSPDSSRIGPRVGVLYQQLQTVIRMYRANKLSRIIDGEVTTLGIRHDGTYLDDEEFKNSDGVKNPPMTPP